eukprot:CAMPEP_0176488114 /NCGR_PEP_ID=MMETSP0200_2-20121128/6531_1 /TAXON_ID=947934 /ORGANISM="Chaetoceros sp., Strain GSL56" /LENGTH=515 /DNA_ID=CAMNT_0017885065 /DNA_START=220 /DNA_END=1767 /DNA_ORIENTATION=+
MSRSSSSSSPITVVLSPIENPRGQDEILDPRFDRRPPLTMCYPPVTRDPKEMPNVQDCNTMSLEHVQGVYPLSLGRNVLTRVHDTKLSRRLATLEFQRPKIGATSSQRSLNGSVDNRGGNLTIAVGPQLVLRVNQSNKLHKVCLNGSRVLVDEVDVKNNDVIALHGEKYKYRVIIIRDEATGYHYTSYASLSGSLDVVRTDNGIMATSNSQTGSSLEKNSNPTTDISFQTQTTIATTTTTDDVNHHSQETLQESLPSQQQVGAAEENLKQEDNDNMAEQALDKIQSMARQHILDDVSCTICMEILVHTHVANPCGHVFCKSCIDRIPSVRHKRYMTKSCPSCRKEITSLSWARSYDNIIWNMVLMGEIFGEGVHGEEDLKQFMIRSGKNLNDLTEDQKACVFQRCSTRNQGKKKRKFGSFAYSGPTFDNINVDHFLNGEGEDEEESDGSVVIADTPPPRHIAAIHHMNFARGLPAFYGTAENNYLSRQRFLQGFNSANDVNGHAGTVEDPICLDD